MADCLKIKFRFSYKKEHHDAEWPWTDYMALTYVLNNQHEANQINSGPYKLKLKEPCSVKVSLSKKGKLDLEEVEDSVRSNLSFLQKLDFEKYNQNSYPTLFDNIRMPEIAMNKQVYAEKHGEYICIAFEKPIFKELERIVRESYVQRAPEDVSGTLAHASNSTTVARATLSSPRDASHISSAREYVDGMAGHGSTSLQAGQSSMRSSRGASHATSSKEDVGGMAAQGSNTVSLSGKVHHSWQLDRTCTVVVTQKTVEESGATYILDMFETYRERPEFKISIDKDVATVQFPVRYHDRPNSDQDLRCSFHRLMDEFKPKTLAVDLRWMHHKSWPILEFIETVISCLQSRIQRQKSANGGGERLDIYFCSASPADFENICKRMDTVFSEAAPRLPASVHMGEKAGAGSMKKAWITIEVKLGSLETEKADALVCTMRSDLNLRKAGASAALLKAAGDRLQDELKNIYGPPLQLDYGEIAVVHGHKLNCQYVLLGVMNKYDPKYDAHNKGQTSYYTCTVHDFMRQCLLKAEELGVRSLAFPAVGCGNLQFPVDIVAKEMFQAVKDYETNYPTSLIRHISFVIYHLDEAAFEVFRKEEKKYSPTCEISDVYDATTVKDLMSRKTKQQEDEVEHLPENQAKHKLDDLNPDVAGATSKRIKTGNDPTPDSEQQRDDKPEPKLKLHLPSNLSMDATEFFMSKLLRGYSKKNFKFTFCCDFIECDGPEKYFDFFKTEFVSSRNKLEKEVQSDKLDVSSKDGTVDVFGKEFEDMGVFVEYDKQAREIRFYGKKWDDIQSVKQTYNGRIFGVVTKIRGKRQFVSTDGSDVTSGGATGGPSDGGARKKTGATGGAAAAKAPFSWSQKTSFVEVFTIKSLGQQVTVRVYSADILDVPVDCIVNAANGHLNHGGGVAKFIAKAAGKKLVDEGDRYIKKHGPLKVGEACSTTAGQLPYLSVIHTVGPCWSWYKPHNLSKVKDCEIDLKQAIKNALSEAEKLGCSSVGIPAVSAGKYGCPAELCAFQYAKAVLRYIGLSQRPLQEIHFIDMSIPMVKQIQKVFHKVAKKGDYFDDEYSSLNFCADQTKPSAIAGSKAVKKGSHLTASSLDKDRFASTHSGSYESQYPNCLPEAALPDKGQIFTCFFSQNHKLMVYKGDIMSLKNIDVITCGEDVKGNSNGYLSTQLHHLGKASYQFAKKKAFSNAIKGDVIVCTAGENRFKHVAHAILDKKKDAKDEDERKNNVNSVFSKLFKEVVKMNHQSLAMPLLGSGKGKADPTFYTERLFESILNFSKAHSKKPLQIHLVNIEPDKTENAIRTIQQQVRSIRTMPPAQGHRLAPARPKSAAPVVTKARKAGRGRSEDKAGHRPSSATRGQEQKAAGSHSRNKFSARDTDESSSDDGNDNIDNWNEQYGKGSTADSGRKKYTSTATAQTSNTPKQKGNLNLIELDSDEDAGDGDSNADAISEDVRHLSISEGSEERRDDLNSDDSDPGDFDQQDDLDDCVICMDKVTVPRKLPCGHTFCTDCIEAQFVYKQACPTCGAVCGIITGDQPDGRMDVHINQNASCAGYERCGRIQITYSFPNGYQQSNHPEPGKPYKGIKRSGYLPDNKRGREVLEMLKVAFDRKLVFTIGNSRTTGQQGVITWNDIHHKTDPQPKTPFGYPDPTYLDRVVDELKAKGVTPADIPKHGHSTYL